VSRAPCCPHSLKEVLIISLPEPKVLIIDGSDFEISSMLRDFIRSDSKASCGVSEHHTHVSFVGIMKSAKKG
jgi:hypothetical protein